jgi:CRP/FNR family transcriptional regulator, cAMP and macrophage regulator
VELRDAGWLARCVGRGDLAPFDATDIEELTRVIGLRHVAAGTLLLRDGEPVQHIGIVVDGTVALSKRRNGRRATLQILHPGDVYGDIPLLCASVAPFDARSLTDAAVIHIPADRLWQWLHTRPHVCRRLLFSLASRLAGTQQRLLELTSGGLTRQVATLLLDETQTRPGTIGLSQATIAELLGTTRPSVNRTLRALEADGLVALSYRRIEVTDPAGLRRVAG